MYLIFFRLPVKAPSPRMDLMRFLVFVAPRIPATADGFLVLFEGLVVFTVEAMLSHSSYPAIRSHF